MKSSVVILGAGFSGLSAACFMAKAGWQVTLIEKNDTAGGRARQLSAAGFTFDMGPSWYWMPEVFDRFFAHFGKQTADYYQLERLDPSYRVYWQDGHTDVPAALSGLRRLFDELEPNSGARLEKYLNEARIKYELAFRDLVYKPGLSIAEFLNSNILKNMMKLDVFTSIRKHIWDNFKNPRLRQLLEFPVLFLGALPKNTPALYSLMNYADMVGGTWYPRGGMYAIVEAMRSLAAELGVHMKFSEPATAMQVANGRISEVTTKHHTYRADAVISSVDYHFTETCLIPPAYRAYSDKYWDKRVLAPSCLLYYIGLNKKLQNIRHHSLFFDVTFDAHGSEIYETPQWPTEPLFYLNVPSVTDPSVAPLGCENLVILIPVAPGLTGDTEELRTSYFDKVLKRLEGVTGQKLKDAVVFLKTYSVSDFENDYHSFKGNAYGLANTLRQTAILRPSCKSKKLPNLFYAGQFTVPGPGVPPALISGQVVSEQLLRTFN